MFITEKTIDSAIILWNNTFPCDRYYRKKYNIPYNSIQHREISQIDVFFDVYEDKIFKQHSKKVAEAKEIEKEYSRGNLLNSKSINEIDKDIFDNLKI
jgi:hypothetical protein